LEDQRNSELVLLEGRGRNGQWAMRFKGVANAVVRTAIVTA